jgi:hypothetical protein
MIQDITRQPQTGMIGGLTDFMVDFKAVTDNLFRSNDANPQDGTTSTEMGADHDPSLVSLSETLTPDRPAGAVAQAIPWGILAVVAVIFFFATKD